MSAAHPFPGIAYLRTLRRAEGGNWWRMLLAILLGGIGLIVMAVVALLLVIAVAWAIGVDYDIDLDNVDAGILLATNLGLAALIPTATGVVWLLYGVRPRWVSSHRPGLRWRWLFFCAAIAAAVWSALFVLITLASALERSTPLDSAVYGFLAVVIFTTPFQAAGEEYLFRGLVLQSLGATRMPAWLCMAISAGLFATAHGQFEPPLFADRFVLGVALAWLAIRTGGLEAGIAIHAVKNLSVLIPASLLDEVDDALDPTGVTWLPLIVDVGLLAIVIPWMLALTARRRRDGRLLPGEPQPWLAEAEAAPPIPYGYYPWPPYGWAPPPHGWQPPPYGWSPHQPPTSPPWPQPGPGARPWPAPQPPNPPPRSHADDDSSDSAS